jgi:hypothetical protein
MIPAARHLVSSPWLAARPEFLDTGPGNKVPHPIIFPLPGLRNGTPAGVLS